MRARLRGLAGIVVVWAAAWGALGLVLGTLFLAWDPAAPLHYVIAHAAAYVAWGAAAGALFAGLLAGFERGRTVGALRGWRAAGWGALSALALPGALLARRLPPETDAAVPAVVLAACAVLGAVAATVSLRLARRPATASAPAA